MESLDSSGVRKVSLWLGHASLQSTEIYRRTDPTENLEALALRGRLICVGTMAGAKSEIDLGLLLQKRVSVIGTTLRGRSIEEKAEATRLFASSILPLVSRGAIRPVIDHVYPADEIRDAHERMESNASVGKIVLIFA